jgi:hypothetical protein
MTAYSRAGFKWSINEILSLQREFELLGWDINQIADKHKRSPLAIIHRLDQEGFADYNVLYSSYYDLINSSSSLNLESDFCQENVDEDDEEYFCEEEQEDSDEDVEDESDEDYQYEEDEDDEEYDDDDEEDQHDDDKIANLSQRVDGLEEGIFEIRDMIKKMMGSFLTQNSSCIGSCN